MKEFVFINTFMNIIFQNESAYIRDFTSSYEYICDFVQWLNQREISMPCLSSITLDDYRIIASCKTLLDIEHMLHIPLSEEMNNLTRTYENKMHILYIPGFYEQVDIHFHHNNDDCCYYFIHETFSKEDLSFFDPFSAFFCAMNHADQWPGALIFNKEESVFCPIHNQDDWNQLIQHVENKDHLFELYRHYQDDSYFLQLSDLHLGREKREKGLSQLYNSLDELVPRLHTLYPLKVLITGDLMESPNRKNMYLANDFMNHLKKRYKADVTFILGNHDVIVHGLNIARRQKSKVIAYLLGENIKVLEKEKMIIIKMDTTSEGNLARGKVGLRQLQEIDDELEAIDHIEEYTLILMIHHHVYPITKAQFIKSKWHERTFLNRIIETSKVLVDAPLLIEWLDNKDIRYVFHGHKHLPFFQKKDNRYYIAGGSATGGLKESRSRYISYNLIKYNHKDHCMKTCMIFYDDKAKAERQRVEVYLFEEENK